MSEGLPDAAARLRQFHERCMGMALREARRAAEEEEVPTGCVIVDRPSDASIAGDGPLLPRVLGRAHNQTEQLKDPTAHAEMLAITQACSSRGDFRLTDSILYVTKEPCAMCAGAIVLARIPMVVIGAADPKRGGISVFNILGHPNLIHRAEVVGGVMEEESLALLRDFFRARRAENRDASASGRDSAEGDACP